VEDLFTPAMYLDLFNATFASALGGRKIKDGDLPAGDRIVDQLTRYLNTEGIELRPSRGFNHYAVATYAASHPPKKWDEATLDRFAALFTAVNPLFSA
jgi:hypothetical protein